MIELNGVTFGTKHSYTDLDLILSSKEVGMPDPKTETVDIPGADGEMDLTEVLTDEIKYGTRTLKFTFTLLNALKCWSSKLSEVNNFLHGKRMRVIMDDDASFYYYGRCKVNSYASSKTLGTIVIEVTAQPYKIDLNSLTEAGTDWLWNPFSFLTGCIYTGAYTVDGTLTVSLYCNGRQRLKYPQRRRNKQDKACGDTKRYKGAKLRALRCCIRRKVALCPIYIQKRKIYRFCLRYIFVKIDNYINIKIKWSGLNIRSYFLFFHI